MSSIKLVVFDMAGTTVQDQHEVEICFIKAASQTGLMVSPERVLALQGYSKRYVFELLWSEQLTDSAEIESKVDESYQTFCEILEKHYLENPVYPTEGCLEIFSVLREKKINIALTTGFYRKVADIILGKLGWLEGLNEQYIAKGNSLIDVSITPEVVKNGRPEPDMIQYAMQIFGITDPKQVINIGDTPSDLLSGQKAGVKYSLGVTNGTHSESQLSLYQNDGLLPNIAAIKKYLN